MFVKIGTMPGTIVEVAVADGSKVSDALAAANLELGNNEIRMSGAVVTEDTLLVNNAIVLLAEKIKGNSTIFVKVGMMPGTIKEIAVEAGTSVVDVLAIADMSIDNFEVRMSGAVVDGNALVTTNGAIILLAEKIKGN